MLTKQIQLRKRLIKYCIILVLTIIIMGGIGFFISNYSDDTESDKSAKESDNNAIRSEYNAIKEQSNMSEKTINLYDKYTKNHNKDLALDRESAIKVLTKLREQYHFTQLEISILPITEITGATFKLKSGAMVKSEIQLSLEAVSDSFIYDFIIALKREFPGIVLVHEIKISRTGELSQNYISSSLSNHKLIPLTKASIDFSWIGIRSNPKEKQNGANNVR